MFNFLSTKTFIFFIFYKIEKGIKEIFNVLLNFVKGIIEHTPLQDTILGLFKNGVHGNMRFLVPLPNLQFSSYQKFPFVLSIIQNQWKLDLVVNHPLSQAKMTQIYKNKEFCTKLEISAGTEMYAASVLSTVLYRL